MQQTIFLRAYLKKIESLSTFAYRFRKNQYFHKDNIRDLIFKGYVIPFIIEDDTIKILSIYKHNLPKF